MRHGDLGDPIARPSDGRNHSAHHETAPMTAPHRAGDGPRPVRAGPGQARPGPCLLTGAPAEAPGSSVTSRDVHQALLLLPVLVVLTVTATLEAGGADTHTQRAIPDLSQARILAPSASFRIHGVQGFSEQLSSARCGWQLLASSAGEGAGLAGVRRIKGPVRARGLPRGHAGCPRRSRSAFWPAGPRAARPA